ncbi:MAG: stage III sporulation protein AF [Thermoleophilia bacterium]|nr:stage III sporulation protein AF [Thermoleophilia bacterium]
MESLADWASRVIVASIFASVVEAAIPGVQMKKYVRLVLGLMIAVALMEPIVSLLSGKPSLGEAAWSAASSAVGAEDAARGGAPGSRDGSWDQAVARQFRSKLEPAVRQALLEIRGVRWATVDVDVARDEGTGAWSLREARVTCHVDPSWGEKLGVIEGEIRQKLRDRYGFDGEVLKLSVSAHGESWRREE